MANGWLNVVVINNNPHSLLILSAVSISTVSCGRFVSDGLMVKMEFVYEMFVRAVEHLCVCVCVTVL